MSRRLLTIKYDGSRYSGWQVQKNAVTIQKTVQNALMSILSSDVSVTGCSRTDSGVHANMYCLHFDTNSNISNERIVPALNSKLPYDIVATNCKFVPDDFHARYSCVGKNYIYKIHNSQIRDPFKQGYYLNVPYNLDDKLMNSACKYFIGTHDFKGFCSMGSSVKSTVRTVTDCSAVRYGDDIIISITADGFLYNMVRIIVGTLLMCGQGKINISELPNIIASCERKKAGPTVKAHGLYLNQVYYHF